MLEWYEASLVLDCWIKEDPMVGVLWMLTWVLSINSGFILLRASSSPTIFNKIIMTSVIGSSSFEGLSDRKANVYANNTLSQSKSRHNDK